jgi:hypothetical protein
MKREIITLCGSTRFMKEFKEVERALTLEGKIPLPPAIYGKAEDIEYPEELSKHLFDLHLDKIRISNGIFVIDVEGKLGDSTKKEIEFAIKNKKTIKYYSKESKDIIKKNEELNKLKIK